MFVKIFRQNGVFVYVNKNNIVFIEPHNSGTGSTITFLNNTSFYSEEDAEVILSKINN